MTLPDLPTTAKSFRPLSVFAASLLLLLLTVAAPRHDASAITIIDELGIPLDTTAATPIGGDSLGFEFVTPVTAFVLEQIHGSWAAQPGYSGASTFQLFQVSGASLIPASAPILALVPITTLATFDINTQATILDFSSQLLSLIPNTPYAVLGVNNGTGNFGVYTNGGGDPVPNSATVYDPAGALPHTTYPTIDTAHKVTGSPIPEPGTAVLLVFAGLMPFIRHRRRRLRR